MLKAFRDPMSDVFKLLDDDFDTELKMCHHEKVVLDEDTEIEGSWGLLKSKSQCRLCGTELQLVPRTGHTNSAYWVNEQPDSMVLKACPNECLESVAVANFREYQKNSEFVKGETHNWEYDYTTFRYGWITPLCDFLFCEYMGHIYALPDDISWHSEAELKGYIKFTSTGSGAIEFSWGCKPSKNQQKIIRDCATDRSYKMTNRNEWYLDQTCGSILITKE